jgi:hypothetical protein
MEEFILNIMAQCFDTNNNDNGIQTVVTFLSGLCIGCTYKK